VLRFYSSFQAPASDCPGAPPLPADAIFIHDLKWRFLEADQTVCEWLGYSREELLGKTVLEVQAPEALVLLSRRMEELRQNGHIVAESALVLRDGRTIPVQISSRMIEYAGRPAVLSVVRNITERKQMEEERANLEEHLVQVQKMEAIGQLATSVAHDCSNLLFVINGRTELILGRLGRDDPMRKELAVIHKSSARAAVLVHKLLASSREEQQG